MKFVIKIQYKWTTICKQNENNLLIFNIYLLICFQTEYLDEDFFNNDDDDDYIPPATKKKTKFKKPNLSDIKVFKEKTKPLVKRIKILRKKDLMLDNSDLQKHYEEKPGTLITCCEFIIIH